MYLYPKQYDVLVIGAGHAGIEAALVAARMGCKVAMLTQNLDTIGSMSCNPAIGGLAKGHMVREIDALGGAMAENTDATAIQWRMLNMKKGPSVRAPRAQCDKKAYQFRMKHKVESQKNLDLHQGNVAEILTKNDSVYGIRTSLQMEIHASTIILSAGTFMRGLMHVGLKNEKGGRMGDAISTVSDSLKQLGFEVERFKTGTPCRINGRSIDHKQCERQDGDTPPPLFSYIPENIQQTGEDIFTLNAANTEHGFNTPQVPCWITWTNQTTHDIISANLDQSPMYAGRIESLGPRYCPSIEDKVVKFAEKERHQVFLEPEGRHTNEYYINGVSTSLPYEVQFDFIRSIKGLENAEIIRPGYAVEYDYCPPTQLFPTLETKRVENLFFAGQINGTSGYEEAAAQGLMAGINAALKVKKEKQFILGRDEAYIGVMIDDLVTKGCTEPYRMFTSRAEYRLLLRQDNADLRLTPRAAEIGAVTAARAKHTAEKIDQIEQASTFIRETAHQQVKLDLWFRRAENQWQDLPESIQSRHSPELWDILETNFKYEGHINRQQRQVEKLSKIDKKKIPASIDYNAIVGMKKEAKQRLEDIKPQNLGQAARISGITPADITLLSIWIEKQQREQG